MESNLAIPILPTLNIHQTAHFYKHALGFEVQNDISYAIARREGIEIHFQRCNNVAVCENSACYIRVLDADLLYSQFFRKGVIHPECHIETKSWGMREFAVIDNMGNTLWFGERSKGRTSVVSEKKENEMPLG